MKDIKCLSAAVAAVMLVCAAPVFADATSMSINEQAAALKPGEWIAAPMTGSASDIVTVGNVAKTGDNPIAYAQTDSSSYTTDATVNGVPFSNSRDSFTFTPNYGIFGKDNGSNCGLDTYYGNYLMKGYWKGNIAGNSGATTFTVTVPAAGTYLMQLVIHHTDTDKVYLTADEDVAIYGGKDKTSSEDWYYGGTFVHAFTMEAAGTYQFILQYSGEVVFNMFQLRDITPVPTIAEQAEALEIGEWLAAPLTGDPSDILTLGEPITYTAFNETYTNAYAAGADTGVLSLGGVDFVRGDSYKNVYGGGAVYGGHQQGDCGVAAPYGSMLNELYFKDATTLTLTIGPDNGYPALVSGEDYLAQLFIHSALWEDTATVANTDKSVRFCAQNSGDDWYYGGTFIHKFTATGKNYSFTINYSNSRAIYNAVLIRKLPKVIRPVVPSFALGMPATDGASATITLESVVKGTDSTGETQATSYDVFAYTGDDPAAATEVASDQSGTTASFKISDLEAGTYVYNVYIVNDQGVSSATNAVTVKNTKPINEWVAAMSVGDWQAVPMTGSPSDIATVGEISKAGNYPMAYAKDGPFGGDTTVNGVLFRDSKENLALDPNIWTNQSNDKDCGTSGDYKTIMTKFWGSQTASGSEGTSFTYSDLDPNKTYLVQIILHNGRDDQFGKGYQYAATAGGETVYFSSETSDGEWYYGGTLLHVFKPDQDGNYTFHVLYTKTTDGSIISAQLNAIQLRDITPVLTIAEQAAALTAADGWLGLQMTGEASDFATKGELVFAYSATATEAGNDVANVPFAIREDWTKFNAGSNTRPAGGVWYRELDKSGTDYGKILSNGYTGGTPNTDNAFKVMGLTAGETYLIQMIIHNGRGTDSSLGGAWTDEFLGTATAGGQQVQYGAAAKGDAWYYGGTLIKVFTADTNGEFAFNVTYGARDPQWNAVQVRHLASYIHGSSGFILIVR